MSRCSYKVLYESVIIWEQRSNLREELLPMSRETATDLVGAAALSLTTIVLLWLPAFLQV
ncbi:hypothetical protein PANO111632_13390 [Paracoccus nototheniae]